MKQIQNFLYAIFWVSLTAYVGHYFTSQGVNGWYKFASKPEIVPADYVFPLVWSILYGLMVFSFTLILSHRKNVHFLQANILFISQLALHILWCFLFFSQKELALALAVLIYLDFVVYKMLRAFKKIKPLSYYVMLPYFVWILFATILNIAFL